MNFTIDSAFLNALANPAPTPAGGSAAAYSGAMAAALVAMVARTTLGKKKYADVQVRIQQIIAEAEDCRAELEACVSRDADAFDGLLASYRAAKDSPDPAAVEQANLHVTEVPLGTSKIALRVMELAVELAAKGNINAIGDAYAAASLANSCIMTSTLNVKFNAKNLGDKSGDFFGQAAEIESRVQSFMMQLQQIIRERGEIGS
ncbi:MAG: methenyltetrahydrofolate cyclohydrolase [Anaerolineaceae bacterium]|nr:methenyltetrahydrofolate cyclohydrolase [Anaerolineaceae bacterium]